MKNIRSMPLAILFMAFIFQLLPATGAQSQNAPVTTLATVGNATPGPIPVPVTVTGFSNIGAISLTFDYQYSVMHFAQVIPNSLLPGISYSDLDLGTGKHRITLGWFGPAVSLAAGSVLTTLNFNFIGGFATIEFYDNGSSCEYADAGNNVLNDSPTATYYINGAVCGGVMNTGAISGNTMICAGQTGMAYSVTPVANATGYAWSVPAGAAITGSSNANAVTVDFPAGTVSGNISVNAFNPCGPGPSSQLWVNVNPLPAANAGPDKTIAYGTGTTLNAASGGTGTFLYHWSPEALLVNPDVQNPQTVNLTNTTIFTLQVTGAGTTCQAGDQVTVTITGGPLSASPVAIPGDICHGGTSQLFANAGSGSGNYSYLWSCTPAGTPPWSSTLANPVVSPDESKLYHLSVSDGFTSVNSSVSLSVFQLPTAFISGGDTLCGNSNATTLRVDLTGTPPWLFTWTNGLTSVTVHDLYTTPYYFTTGDAGSYTIQNLHDANCTGNGFGSAKVAVFPYPATPQVTLIGTTLVSSVCCGNQWYLNNAPIPGATGQNCQATGSGLYFDIVTQNTCSSDTSQKISVLVGMDEKTGGRISLAPNPAGDFVTIRGPWHAGEHLRVILTTANGQVVFQYGAITPGTKEAITVGLSGVAPGLYFVTVHCRDFVSTSKLLVSRP